jgi:hypothetical protein
MAKCAFEFFTFNQRELNEHDCKGDERCCEIPPAIVKTEAPLILSEENNLLFEEEVLPEPDDLEDHECCLKKSVRTEGCNYSRVEHVCDPEEKEQCCIFNNHDPVKKFEVVRFRHQEMSCVNDRLCFFNTFDWQNVNALQRQYMAKYCHKCKIGYAENETPRTHCPKCLCKFEKKKASYLPVCGECGELVLSLETQYRCMECVSVLKKMNGKRKRLQERRRATEIVYSDLKTRF